MKKAIASEKLVTKQAVRLGLEAEEREAFVRAIIHPDPLPSAIAWLSEPRRAFREEPALSWQPDFVQRIHPNEAPGKHPWHTEGAYYCLDMSSVFASTVLTEIKSTPRVVLDLCAAPGGKSILSYKLLKPELLVSNEVVGKRLAPLIANLERCKLSPILITRNDPRVLADNVAACFDLVVVDAPCSGQSLFARGQSVDGAFHKHTINMCMKRQRRIISDAANLVPAQGHLAYMTCTYSIEENEKLVEWFLKKNPDFESVRVNLLADYQSSFSEQPCYRIWPQNGEGAGSFTTLLHRVSGPERNELDQSKLNLIREYL